MKDLRVMSLASNGAGIHSRQHTARLCAHFRSGARSLDLKANESAFLIEWRLTDYLCMA